eukprot:SAG31_NODE_39_length_31377_cov_5.971482_7_plen_125_part_00
MCDGFADGADCRTIVAAAEAAAWFSAGQPWAGMVVGQKGGGLGDDEANCRVSSLCREAARALESWLFSHGGQAKPRLRLKPLAAVLSRSNGIRDAVQGAVFTATSLKLSGAWVHSGQMLLYGLG